MLKINNTKEKISVIFNMMLLCFKISWQASNILFIVRTLLEIVTGFCPIVSLYIGKEIINSFVNTVSTEKGILQIRGFTTFLLLLFAIHILSKVLEKIKEFCDGIHNELTGKLINLQIVNKSLELDLSYFDNLKFYIDMVNVRRDSNALQHFTWQLLSIIRSIIQFAGVFYILANLNILFAFIIISVGVPTLFMEKKYTGMVYNWERKWVNEDRKMGYLMSIITGQGFAKDVRLFNMGKDFINRYLNIWNKRYVEKKSLMKKRSIWVGFMTCLPEIAWLFLAFYIGNGIINGQLTVGDYSLYTGSAIQLTGSLFAVISLFSRMYENKLMLVNYNTFMNQKSRVSNEGKLKLESLDEIEFVNVNFQYPGTDLYILKNLCLKINKLEKVALVGLNGAGKSTIVKLLLRFYDPTEGKILVNGKDIKLYDLESYRKQFSAIFQDFTSYAFSIKDSITLSALDEKDDMDRLKQACEKSGAQSVIDKFEKGIDTFLSRQYEEDGKELSGGEWQKMALARTFFRNGSFIILDEPSAALDPEAEHKIFNTLLELCSDKGALFISHRLSNVLMANRIIVLKDGMVIEDGSHNQLMKEDGVYAYLFNLQADKYKAG